MRTRDEDDELFDEDEIEEEAPRPRRSRGRRILRALFSLTLLAFVAFAALCLFIDIYGHQDYARPADAILVFGARVAADHQPGDSLRARTRQAVSLYERKLAPRIIFTGGVGDYTPTEAQAAATLAIQLGVPERDIFLETTSKDTTQNVQNAARLYCRKNGWNRVIAVSDPYHLWRVARDCRAAGLTPYTSPARNCARNRNLSQRAIWTARDALALMRDLAGDGLAKLRR